MFVEIKPSMAIDAGFLFEQRSIIGNLIANLESGRTGISVIHDLDGLIIIRGILNTIGKAADRAGSVDEDDVADLARKVVEGWDIEACITSAEQSLIDFWTDTAGADDYDRCQKEYSD